MNTPSKGQRWLNTRTRRLAEIETATPDWIEYRYEDTRRRLMASSVRAFVQKFRPAVTP